jgi:COP9 signalosome complex subunit 1
MAPEDVAVYGSLCALATFDREETKALVLDNSRFRNFLELNPPVRELVHDFYNSRYASCLQYIEALKPTLDLDIHLRDHVASLIADIRKRALLQYFSPYLSVNLTNMAESLNSTPSAIEAECAELIMEGKMQARIDSEQKILYARNVDQRVSTYKKAMRIGDQYIADTKVRGRWAVGGGRCAVGGARWAAGQWASGQRVAGDMLV